MKVVEHFYHFHVAKYLLEEVIKYIEKNLRALDQAFVSHHAILFLNLFLF